jgi:hypothetical protein
MKEVPVGVTLFKNPQLNDPVLIASWPGIGSIGTIVVDALRRSLEAEEFAEIEPWEFFYPKKVLIRSGVLEDIEFPSSRFYYKKMAKRDLMLFLGEEQPSDGGRAYAAGEKAYRMASLVLDVAQRFGCRRVYTSGAAVAAVHHTARPRVWAVPNSEHLIDEISGYNNTVLMSDIEGRGGQGSITGLNGLLLGVAKMRSLEAICLMGEIPIYLQGLPFPYPKASKAVAEVLAATLGLDIDWEAISAVVEASEKEIEKLYAVFPAEIKEQLDRLREASHAQSTEPGPITEEDKRRILEDIDKLFGRESKED